MTGTSRRSKDGSVTGSMSFVDMATEKADVDKERNDVSQATFVKLRKVRFIPRRNRIVWLGYSEGRCAALWKRSEDSEGVEPFEELFRLQLEVDPFDICPMSSEMLCVSFSNGQISLLDCRDDELVKIREFQNVHGKGNARVLCQFDSHKVISGSSNGSLATVDVETGDVSMIATGNSGVRSICTLSGGTLLASGHSAGHVLIWDCRQKSSKPASVFVPSKRRIDTITALTNHSAQASLISFGTDLGTVGFCDIRGVSHSSTINSFDVATSTITQVGFHNECGDHFVCASADGSLVRWDVSGVIA
ncbi:unnamed protein product [Nippostrongylus brasiliensis]|uniref:WD_REPEATS_REGION domain-containing protein n=1 Tax=Nippostrongylus brasiliensis TaxID=27835 RepID=A0A0N4Y136_NIPBR|nr:unnamed protein product [Nippostrongylus brasiliensis]